MVAIAGPTYTITAADRNKVLVASTAAAFTIASDLGDGFQGSILNIGTGQPTITLGGGVTAVTDGTEPLRLNPGPSAAALFKAGGTLSILGLYRVSASFSVATASDYWTGAAGLLIPTPQAFAEGVRRALDLRKVAAPGLDRFDIANLGPRYKSLLSGRDR